MGDRIRADRKGNTNKGLRKVMKCLSSSEEPSRKEDDVVLSSESLATKGDTINIEEVESSPFGSGCLNYEERLQLKSLRSKVEDERDMSFLQSYLIPVQR